MRFRLPWQGATYQDKTITLLEELQEAAATEEAPPKLGDMFERELSVQEVRDMVILLSKRAELANASADVLWGMAMTLVFVWMHGVPEKEEV